MRVHFSDPDTRLIEDLSSGGIVPNVYWEGDCTSRLEMARRGFEAALELLTDVGVFCQTHKE